MDLDQWTTVSRLLDEALDLPVSSRAAWVDGLGTEYAALKPHLRVILTQAARLDTEALLGALPQLVSTAGHTGPEDGGTEEGVDSRVGARVGPYTLIRLIARGGQGSVWLATRADGLLTRPVALKLPHARVRRPGLAERMARERDILATLTHAHIARLYDAGVSADGEPFLALEYVEGTAIDAHASARSLSTASRVRLFIPVVRAVAFAHGRLVIHRDLKPSNILVTAEGDIRLLDFGIAKLLDERTEDSTLTVESGRAMTLAYASPEQVAAEPLGVASDVYALGVVLFELLTGRRPYALARESTAALEEAILTQEAPRASDVAQPPAARKALAGDLDTILAKALKKAPVDRYTSAAALADDLERFLDGRPVEARPDSRVYRARKFLMRHKVGVAAATASLVSILGGAGVATWQAGVARSEQRRAEDVKNFITSVFREADPYEGKGQALSAVDLLKQATARVARDFDARPDLRVELLGLIGISLLGLEDFQTAEATLQEAVDLARAQFGTEDPRTLELRGRIIQAHRYLGKTDQMAVALDEVLPGLRRHARTHGAALAQALRNRAHLAIDQGRYDAAREAAREALQMAQDSLGATSEEALEAEVVAAVASQYADPPEDALAAAERAYRRVAEAFRDRPGNPKVIDAQGIYGRALGNAGRLRQGIEQLQQVVEAAATVMGPAASTVGFYAADVARLQLEAGDVDGAVAYAARASDILTKQTLPGSYTHAAVLQRHGAALLAARRYREAMPYLEKAAEGLERAVGPEHEATVEARALHLLTRVLRDRDRAALSTLTALAEKTPTSRVRAYVAVTHALAIARRRSGDPDGATTAARAALAALPDTQASQPRRSRLLKELALADIDRSALGSAAKLLEESAEASGLSHTTRSPDAADQLVGLGRVRLGVGEPEAAVALLERAITYWKRAAPGHPDAVDAARWLARARAAASQRHTGASSVHAR